MESLTLDVQTSSGKNGDRRWLLNSDREGAENNYAAYAPDLPGCVTTGETKEETEQQMQEATEFHIRGLREDGLPNSRTIKDSQLC